MQYVVIGRQTRIPAALAGDSDVDILVAREDSGRAEMALLRLGFEERGSRSGHGAVGSFVRWEAGGPPVRVELHYELRLGFGVAPSFRIHTAGELIQGSGMQDLVRVPSASDHLALHLVKGLLAWEATDLLAGRRRHPFDADEVRLLLRGISREDFVGSTARIFPPLPSPLAGRVYIEAQRLDRGEIGVAARLRLTSLSMAVRDSLAAWSDRPLLLAWLRSVRLRFARLFASRSPQVVGGRDQSPSVDGPEPMPAQ